MRALGRFLWYNIVVQEQLATYNCQMHQKVCTPFTIYLNIHVETMLEATCCTQISQPALKFGSGSTRKTPSLILWACLTNKFINCGVDTLETLDFPILVEDNRIIQNN